MQDQQNEQLNQINEIFNYMKQKNVKIKLKYLNIYKKKDKNHT